MIGGKKRVGINTIFVCPSLKVRNALIRVLAETGGPAPILQSESASAKRAHYAPATSKVIMNTPAASMIEALGVHRACIAIEVADRVAAAEKARAIFAEEGFGATVHVDIEPEFPEGFLSFVVVKELDGVILLFWPRPEDVTPELAATLPQRTLWGE